jgi:uncharacterized protein (UPF0303 family)
LGRLTGVSGGSGLQREYLSRASVTEDARDCEYAAVDWDMVIAANAAGMAIATGNDGDKWQRRDSSVVRLLNSATILVCCKLSRSIPSDHLRYHIGQAERAWLRD